MEKMLGLTLRQRLILSASEAGWTEFWLSTLKKRKRKKLS